MSKEGKVAKHLGKLNKNLQSIRLGTDEGEKILHELAALIHEETNRISQDIKIFYSKTFKDEKAKGDAQKELLEDLETLISSLERVAKYEGNNIENLARVAKVHAAQLDHIKKVMFKRHKVEVMRKLDAAVREYGQDIEREMGLEIKRLEQAKRDLAA